MRTFIFALENDLVSFLIDNKCGNVRIKLGKLISKFKLLIYLFTLLKAHRCYNIDMSLVYYCSERCEFVGKLPITDVQQIHFSPNRIKNDQYCPQLLCFVRFCSDAISCKNFRFSISFISCEN